MRLRDRARRELIPAPAPAPAREIVAHVGAQTVRWQPDALIEMTAELLRFIETWKAQATGKDLLLYAAMKQAANMGIPVLRARIESNPFLPNMPERPRHTDPIEFLIGYFNVLVPFMLSQGEFTVPVDEDGNAGTFHWSFLDQIDAFAQRKPQVIDAAQAQDEEGEV